MGVAEVVKAIISSSSYGGANLKKVASLKIVNDGSGVDEYDNYVVRAKINESVGGETGHWAEHVYRLEGCDNQWLAIRLVEEALKKLRE